MPIRLILSAAFLGLAFPLFSCQQASSTAPAEQSSGLSSLADAYVCSAKSLFHPDLGTWAEGGPSIAAASRKARATCEQFSGNQACVIERCGAGMDSGASDLLGPAVCEWEDLQTGMSGYTEGETRAAARHAARADCEVGSGHPAGIECTVKACVAKGAARVNP